MVVGNLISIARERLGDVKQHRWTEYRLLTIVGQGQASICKLTSIYRQEAFISLANDVKKYTLPADCMTLKRIEYNGNVIPLFNRNDIDGGKQPTEEFVALKDNLPMGKIELYPPLTGLTTDIVIVAGENTADDTFTITPVYGVSTQIGVPYEIVDVYGVVTNLTSEVDLNQPPQKFGELVDAPETTDVNGGFSPSVNGVVVGMEVEYSTDPALFGFITGSDTYDVVGKYGLVTTIADPINLMKIFYDAVPSVLVTNLDTLVIPDIWEEAMIRYIVGTALQDDNDASNIQRGELELAKFTAEVLKARELSTKDFSSGTKEKYNTTYRRT